jgi:hypothetical protein
MPLRYVDPHKKHSRRYRAVESLGRSRPGQFLARNVRVSPLGWWDFGAEADRVREGLGVSLRVLGWAIA